MTDTQQTAIQETTVRTPAEFYARVDECMTARMLALLETRGVCEAQDTTRREEEYRKTHPGYSPLHDLIFLAIFCLLERDFQKPFNPGATDRRWDRAKRLLRALVMKGCFERGELDEFVGARWE